MPREPGDRERIAVLSDVHGNRRALQAVLADAARRGARRFVNLGDSVYGPLDPEGTAILLVALACPTVQGNEDRLLGRPPAATPASPSLDFVLGHLSPTYVTWLLTLPMTATVGGALLLCHGTPADDETYLLRRVGPEGLEPRSAAEVAALLEGVTAPVILCGHDHLPGTLRLPDGRLVVNPGSVGLPAYADDVPHPHAVACGSPHARYAILERRGDRWEAEQLAVAYDWTAAAATAARNGRPDWALWLRTGRAGIPVARPGDV